MTGSSADVDLPIAVADAISAELRAAVSSLCHVARETDTPLYLVGGMVRDRLLLKEPPAGGALDLDLAVDADPAPLIAALPTAQWVDHDRFGSASVRLADGSRIDLVRTRSERYPAPAALPVVEPAPIEADLGRRDFTINAAAFALSGPHSGALLDPHGGARDAARRRLRALHPRSFRDDPTRLIRLCRYAARIAGRADTQTARLARESAADPSGLAALTPARFGDAWRALIQDTAAVEALRRARRLRLPRARLAGWEVSAQTGAVLRGSGDVTERFWAAVGLTCSDPEVVTQLPRLAALRRGERAALFGGAALRAGKPRIARARNLSEAAERIWRAPQSAQDAAAELWHGAAAERLREFLARRDCARSPLSGGDLLALGVPAGPAVGIWQRRLERAIWDDELPQDSAARIALAEQWVRSSPTAPPDNPPMDGQRHAD